MGQHISKEEHENMETCSTGICENLKFLNFFKSKAPILEKVSVAAEDEITEMEKNIRLHSNIKARPRREKVLSEPLDFRKDFSPPIYEKSEDIFNQIKSSLSKNFIFNNLSDKDIRPLIGAMSEYKVNAGDNVIHQGDMGDFFYVIELGTITFVVDGNEVGTCDSGGSFGELALLYDCPRNATCIAKTKCTLWRVERRIFRHILAKNAMKQNEEIIDVLKKAPLLSHLSDSILYKLIEILTPIQFERNKRIIEKGGEGNIFYIILEGQVICHDVGKKYQKIANLGLGPGETFGERSLLLHEPRAANVTALTDCSLLCVSREIFEKSMGSLKDLMIHGLCKRVIMSLPLFSKANLKPQDLERIAKSFVPIMHPKGYFVEKFGEPVKKNGIYIIKDGSVEIEDCQNECSILSKSDHFGGENLKEGIVISERSILVNEETSFLFLSKTSIESVIISLSRLGPAQSTLRQQEEINMQSLNRHCILGEGGFGQVWLVTLKTSGKAYALKQMKKKLILSSASMILREKSVLSTIDHPFIINLFSSFQDKSSIYILITFVQGGELYTLLSGPNLLSERAVVFYAACVLESINYLHTHNICYRDLKPENVLIDSCGYCILTDMGFAKVVADSTFTLCGTPEYLAPEIILSKGHAKGVDYWTFGILIYEMLFQKTPFSFNGFDQMALFKEILLTNIVYPHSPSKDVAMLINGLLRKTKTLRLGCLAGGSTDVFQHSWFQKINFEELVNKVSEAPWIPPLKNEMDASNFATIKDSGNDSDEVGNDLSEADQLIFENF